MAAETLAEFLARGGSIEKSDEKVTLSELLEKEGIMNKDDAEKLAGDLTQNLNAGLEKQAKK